MDTKRFFAIKIIMETSKSRRSQLSNPIHCSVCNIAPRKNEKNYTHYGAVTCISCKAFFRRAIRNPKALVTFRCQMIHGQCDVTGAKNRTKCKQCRYMRCLKAGMNPCQVLTDEEDRKRYTHPKKNKGKVKDVAETLSPRSPSPEAGSRFVDNDSDDCEPALTVDLVIDMDTNNGEDSAGGLSIPPPLLEIPPSPDKSKGNDDLLPMPQLMPIVKQEPSFNSLKEQCMETTYNNMLTRTAEMFETLAKLDPQTKSRILLHLSHMFLIAMKDQQMV